MKPYFALISAGASIFLAAGSTAQNNYSIDSIVCVNPTINEERRGRSSTFQCEEIVSRSDHVYRLTCGTTFEALLGNPFSTVGGNGKWVTVWAEYDNEYIGGAGSIVPDSVADYASYFLRERTAIRKVFYIARFSPDNFIELKSGVRYTFGVKVWVDNTMTKVDQEIKATVTCDPDVS